MVDKLHDYQGLTGRLHSLRDGAKRKWDQWKEDHPESLTDALKKSLRHQPPDKDEDPKGYGEYSHLYTRKKRLDLIRISTAVMGIEFSYAGETAFVSPTLLKIGVQHQHMTLVWALSPLIGFFLTPVLGSLSDRCRSNLGRRRPFILLLSIGVFIGLILVPNGENIGYAFGDVRPQNYTPTNLPVSKLSFTKIQDKIQSTNETLWENVDTPVSPHPWGILFTILGTALLDFDADACQSPARAYLLDVTMPEDHARGLSTFTIMAGLGGFMGYALGAINWDATSIGILLGGHVKAVFFLITILFVICVAVTVTSFKEIPLDLLEKDERLQRIPKRSDSDENPSAKLNAEADISYGSVNNVESTDTNPFRTPGITINDVEELPEPTESTKMETGEVQVEVEKKEQTSLQHYLMSIVFMPFSLRIVCLTNLFCWMAHVCYSLYFTDFVGESVFQGDPTAPVGSPSREAYEEGIRFGCWGMSMYSLSCSCYSLVIEKLIKRFGARKVYVGGLLTYSFGMMLMAVTKCTFGVIFFSWTAGVMYSTLFTMPYLLVAHYHAQGTFEVTKEGEAKLGSQLRGLGTDVAIISSMVFLAQFILSMCMGSIVSYTQTTTSVVGVASFLAFCGAISASRIMYLDL